MIKKSFSQKLKEFFSASTELTGEFYDDLCDSLIEGDLGPGTAYSIVEELRKKAKTEKIRSQDEVVNKLKEILTGYLKTVDLFPEKDKTNIYLLLGVNGAGKTTTCAKLAGFYSGQGISPVVLAAADTFRAAAIEQLCHHGEKLGIRTISHQHGSDPGAVIFDALESVNSKGGGLVIADTAGRLHTKENLVNELKKIIKIAENKASQGCCKKILVLDSTTGLNGLRQAEVFNEAVGLDGIILTKYDSTAKGGSAFSAGKDLGLPVIFTCFGEKYGDIKKFDVAEYVEGFLS